MPYNVYLILPHKEIIPPAIETKILKNNNLKNLMDQISNF